MKKFGKFFVAALIVTAGYFGGIIMSSYSAPPASSPCVGGTYYINTSTFPIWYGKMDTIAGGATDTFKMSCGCKATSITFSNDQWKCVGAPTLNVAIYASANGGSSYGTTPIATYTVVPANVFSVSPTTNTYLVNSPYGGNTYTNYMWVASNTAASSITAAWQGTVLVR